MMRILIISYEAWNNYTNGGNVLSNIFGRIEAEYAQIYCSSGQPDNKICKKYFQMTDRMLLSRKNKGKIFSIDDLGEEEVSNSNKKRKTIRFGRNILSLAREICWNVAKWKNRELKKFITDFKPDIIFAPCYGFPHMLKLNRYVKKIANTPMISYISDDLYSLKKISFSPFFWWNLFCTRRQVRKTFKEYDLIYTMTKLQKDEYEHYFHKPMKILCKCEDFDFPRKKNVNKPIKIIYAGGIYLNRWKILGKIRKALIHINAQETQAELHIYTGNTVNRKQKKALHDGKNSYLYHAINKEKLDKIYREHDIALHVEAFDWKNKKITRLSFSTKIIDCLNSGCAVMAIGPKGQAGIEYLEENDAAICLFREKEIERALKEIIENPNTICDYAENARVLGRKNHNQVNVTKMLKDDFDRIVRENNA